MMTGIGALLIAITINFLFYFLLVFLLSFYPSCQTTSDPRPTIVWISHQFGPRTLPLCCSANVLSLLQSYGSNQIQLLTLLTLKTLTFFRYSQAGPAISTGASSKHFFSILLRTETASFFSSCIRGPLTLLRSW